MKYLLLTLFTVLNFQGANAQSLSIFDVDTTNFPTIKAKFYAFDAAGQQQRPSLGDLSLTENGVSRTITSVSCPIPPPPRAISSVLVMDVSGSMSDGHGNVANIDLAKKAAQSWVNGLPLGASEAALTSFDDHNYLNQDFTTDRKKLLTSINGITPNNGTNYDAAMINPMAGGLIVSKSGKYQKVIIFLSDGLPNSEPKTAQIINEAKLQNCIIFCVTLGLPAPQCMKDMATQTGGLFFENVTTLIEAEEVYRKILQVAIGGIPCTIEWTNVPSCQVGDTKVGLSWNSQQSLTNYRTPSTSILALQVKPSFLLFGNVPPGSVKDTTITLSAINSDFTVTDITRIYGATEFEVLGATFPFTIAKGTSKSFVVRFIPIDSNLVYTAFNIHTNQCTFSFSVNGGFNGKKMKRPTLKIIKPNGGEKYVAGSDSLIIWEGISSMDTVQIDYSIDNGVSWKLITTKATGLQYLWKNIPLPQSNTCKIRVKQMHRTTNGLEPYTLLYSLPHLSHIIGLEWSPDGSKFATASDSTLFIWDTKSGAKLHTIIVNSYGSNITSFKWNPLNDRIATTSQDGYCTIWDAVNGTKLRSFHDFLSSYPKSLAWSPNGKHLAVGQYGPGIFIWDAISGNIIDTLFAGSNQVLAVSWNPDGLRLATSNKDSVTTIWDAMNGKNLLTLQTNNNLVFDMSWSHDGSSIATKSNGGTTNIWDGVTGNKLRTFYIDPTTYWAFYYYGNNKVTWSLDGSKIVTYYRHKFMGPISATFFDASSGATVQVFKDTSINYTDVESFSLSSDEKRIITTESDVAHIWDVSNGTKIYTLNSSNAYVSNSTWSPDDNFVSLIGKWDNIARIWYVGEDETLQEDSSDSVFSIVAPIPASQNIDMKQCLVGNAKDSVIQQCISNSGTYPFQVDSIIITGNDASQFSLVSGIPPLTVTNIPLAVEFRFKPTSTGIKTAQLLIITQADTLKQTITGEGIAPTLAVVNQLIDFGKVLVNSSRDTIKALTIKNFGNAPLTITATKHAGPNSSDFTTLKGGGGFTLMPDSTAKLDLQFAPKDVGRTSGRLLFEYNGFGSPAMVQLFGEGISNQGTTPSITSTASVQFDSLCLGNSKIIQATIKNNGNLPMQLLRAEWISNTNNVFTTALLPQLLDVDSSISLPIDFTPQTAGFISSHVRWIADLDTTFSIVSGTGKVCSNNNEKDTARTTVAVQDITAQAGEKALLTLKFLKKSGLEIANAPTEWIARIHYNKTILFNVQTNNVCLSGSDDSCVAELSGIYNPNSNELIAVPCVVTLGNTANSTIVIDTFYWKNSSIATETQTLNGVVTVTGICEQGGVRLFIPAQNSTSLTARPNPAQHALQIQYGLREPLTVTLELLSVTGQAVQTIVNNQAQVAGQYILTHDVSQMNSGVYILRLKTNKETLSTRVDVVK